VAASPLQYYSPGIEAMKFSKFKEKLNSLIGIGASKGLQAIAQT